jgi:hypothetical protein
MFQGETNFKWLSRLVAQTVPGERQKKERRFLAGVFTVMSGKQFPSGCLAHKADQEQKDDRTQASPR